MRATERDLPKSISELLGGSKELELNQAEHAACPHCGQEPRLYVHTTSSGLEVVAWIPVEHRCKAASKRGDY